MATGRFALGSREPLGANQSDSVAAKAEGTAFNKPSEGKSNTEVGEGSKATEILTTSRKCGKRKRRLSMKMSCSCSLTCHMQLTMLQILLERLAVTPRVL
jgi:hypothetical protein